MEKEKTKVGAFLQKFAPTLLETAGALTGVDALKELGNAIKGSPALSEDQKAVALNLLEMDIEDRQSARNMQVSALGQDDKFSKRFIYYLASFVMASLFIMFILLFFVEIPEGNSEIVYMAFGIFLGIASSVAAFFFGSSQGSKDKDTSMLNSMKSRRR